MCAEQLNYTIALGTAVNGCGHAIITSQCSVDGMNCDTNSFGMASNERKKMESPSLPNDSMPVCMRQAIVACV